MTDINHKVDMFGKTIKQKITKSGLEYKKWQKLDRYDRALVYKPIKAKLNYLNGRRFYNPTNRSKSERIIGADKYYNISKVTNPNFKNSTV